MTQMKMQPESPTQVVARRVAELRARRGLSAQKLADRCAEYGMPELNRSVITNLENHRRQAVTVDELLTLALTLGVAPLHLLVPTDDTARVAITPNSDVDAASTRAWVVGEQPLLDGEASYHTEVPDGWLERAQRQRRELERECMAYASFLLTMQLHDNLNHALQMAVDTGDADAASDWFHEHLPFRRPLIAHLERLERERTDTQPQDNQPQDR
jgi:transcriptional regulator with XRE-family HTH domain